MFLAILSHDLRNPLNAITMTASLLPRVAAHDPETTAFAAKISTSADIMARMISDLLDYTRTRLGAGMPVARAPMDLGVVCREVIAEFQIRLPRRKPAVRLRRRASPANGTPTGSGRSYPTCSATLFSTVIALSRSS
jgi:signal transduction histidine kinase